ncbi:MAG: 5-oxoprolinase subunit PxpB [Burkholderiales bacterium]|nr:5-oxoprolinase subunit PxpB [Burkholderiales bacterium]
MGDVLDKPARAGAAFAGAEVGLIRAAEAFTFPAHDEPRLSSIGPRGVLLDAPGEFDLVQQARIWTLADEVEHWPGVEEAVLGVTNLLLVFARPPRDLDRIKADMAAAWRRARPKAVSGRVHEVPVVYGGELGSDLARVCDYSGLPPEEVIAIHGAGLYTVCAIGSSPGFGYLHGLDQRIFMPRKTVPSLRMLKGTVTIGGMQAGISVSTGPNGWNAIGWSGIEMFDLTKDPPCLFAPGDQIRFHAERIEL